MGIFKFAVGHVCWDLDFSLRSGNSSLSEEKAALSGGGSKGFWLGRESAKRVPCDLQGDVSPVNGSHEEQVSAED